MLLSLEPILLILSQPLFQFTLVSELLFIIYYKVLFKYNLIRRYSYNRLLTVNTIIYLRFSIYFFKIDSLEL